MILNPGYLLKSFYFFRGASIIKSSLLWPPLIPNYVVITGVSAIQIDLLDVPEMALAGAEVHMTCNYDLERARLYQVKWYKGNHEFYRYSPGELENKKLFLVKNLNIDV